MKRPFDGILLVDKAAGESSHEVVRKVKSAFGFGRRHKVGHAGTLDPFATGLLVVLLGQGTKLSRFIMAGEKEYLATLELGTETDTLDPTGKVIVKREVPALSRDDIEETARQYVGRIRQRPPAFSAVKHRGSRAYKLARKGLPVVLEERTVTVHSLSVLSVELPEVTMRIRCAGGTYIRSLAADMGRDLGPGGRLKALRRLRSGAFDVKDAIPSEELRNSASVHTIGIPLAGALPEMAEILINDTLAGKVRQGYRPRWHELTFNREPVHPIEEGYIKLVSGDNLLAIIKESNGGDSHEQVEFERVFS